MEEEENVLFARNLYPEEIANALVRAMNDDNLVDSTAKNNLEKVYRLADRKVIKQIVSSYYKKICGKIP
jgi:trehalose utilization protein